jgi:competence protein ComEC
VWSRDRRGDRIDAVEITIATPREYGPRAAVWMAFAELGERRELAESLLIGQGRPPERADFRASGLSHVLAVSGMHLALAAALGAWLLQALGLPWAWRLGLLAALCAGYAWLTGGSPATMRALAMVLVVTAAAVSGREPHRLGPVSLAALSLVLIDPGQARDAGFQLSLAAVLGIVTLGTDLIALRQKHLGLRPWPLDRPTWRGLLWCVRTTIDGLLVGAAATLATTPLVAWWFATANPWGVLATAVAGPCATAALWLGLPWLGLTSLWPDGPWTGLRILLEISLELLARAAAWAATWPGATIATPPPAAWLMCVWPLLFIRCPDVQTAALRLGAVAGMLLLWMCFQ